MNVKVRKSILCSFILLPYLSGQVLLAGDQFGRLFTTPAQREHLDELRKIEPEQRVTVEEQTLVIDDVEETEEVSVDALTVRGLVHRSDGNSTAWINNSNTFEGGVASQYIIIGDIGSDKVEITIPTANKAVKLNVGETFDPVSESIKDLAEKPATTVTDPRPAAKQ